MAPPAQVLGFPSWVCLCNSFFKSSQNKVSTVPRWYWLLGCFWPCLHLHGQLFLGAALLEPCGIGPSTLMVNAPLSYFLYASSTSMATVAAEGIFNSELPNLKGILSLCQHGRVLCGSQACAALVVTAQLQAYRYMPLVSVSFL